MSDNLTYRPSVNELSDIIGKLETLLSLKQKYHSLKLPPEFKVPKQRPVPKDLKNQSEDELLRFIKTGSFDPLEPGPRLRFGTPPPISDEDYREIAYRQNALSKMKSDLWTANIRPLIDQLDIDLFPLWPYLNQHGDGVLTRKDEIIREIKKQDPAGMNQIIHEFKKVRRLREGPLAPHGGGDALKQESGSQNDASIPERTPPVTAETAAGTTTIIPDKGNEIEGGEVKPNEGKEVPWNDKDPAYITNSEAVKPAGKGWTVKRLSKLLKPNGEIRYMRKGRRGKVHKADFDTFISNQDPDFFSEEIFKAIADARKKKEAAERAKKKWE